MTMVYGGVWINNNNNVMVSSFVLLIVREESYIVTTTLLPVHNFQLPKYYWISRIVLIMNLGVIGWSSDQKWDNGNVLTRNERCTIGSDNMPNAAAFFIRFYHSSESISSRGNHLTRHLTEQLLIDRYPAVVKIFWCCKFITHSNVVCLKYEQLIVWINFTNN